MIISEINRRFCDEAWTKYPGNWDKISSMAIIAYGQVRMANLSVIGSHTVNGVSALHSEILKDSCFKDFYRLTPGKFTNVTNGIAHRRWLCQSNKELTALLESTIGDGFVKNGAELEKFLKYKDDKEVLAKLLEKDLSIGGEQSGHIIIKDLATTGDGILSAIIVANMILEENKTLSQAIDVELYPQSNKNVIVTDKFRIMNSEILRIEVDKHNETLRGKGRIMIRASGTEPKIRVMVESPDKDINENISNVLTALIKKIDTEF
jgi:hypothetical protein